MTMHTDLSTLRTLIADVSAMHPTAGVTLPAHFVAGMAADLEAARRASDAFDAFKALASAPTPRCVCESACGYVCNACEVES